MIEFMTLLIHRWALACRRIVPDAQGLQPQGCAAAGFYRNWLATPQPAIKRAESQARGLFRSPLSAKITNVDAVNKSKAAAATIRSPENERHKQGQEKEVE
jgi:hypothetical protein